jgi:hypothetical protein
MQRNYALIYYFDNAIILVQYLINNTKQFELLRDNSY